MNELIPLGVLAFSNICLLVYIYTREKQFTAQTKELIRAVLSKNLTDFTSSSIIEEEQEKLKAEDKVRITNLPADQIGETEFDEHIKKINQE